MPPEQKVTISLSTISLCAIWAVDGVVEYWSDGSSHFGIRIADFGFHLLNLVALGNLAHFRHFYFFLCVLCGVIVFFIYSDV